MLGLTAPDQLVTDRQTLAFLELLSEPKNFSFKGIGCPLIEEIPDKYGDVYFCAVRYDGPGGFFPPSSCNGSAFFGSVRSSRSRNERPFVRSSSSSLPIRPLNLLHSGSGFS